MERFALRRNVRLIAVKSPEDEKERGPHLQHFEKKMEFSGKKERVVVYVLRKRPTPKKGPLDTPKPPL